MSQKSAESNELSVINLISNGTTIHGNMSSNGDVRIDGQLNGNITAPGKVVTGASSEINGDLRIGSGKIGGKVFGNIYSTGTLEIESTAKVEGRIESNGLIIQEGANLKAEISSKTKAVNKTQDNQPKIKTQDFSRAAVL